VGGIVTQDFEPLGHLARDDRNSGVPVDNSRKIARPTVDPDGNRRLGETRPDCAGKAGS